MTIDLKKLDDALDMSADCYGENHGDMQIKIIKQAARAYHTQQKAPPVDHDMSDQQLRLYMGELSASEMRVARAAIRLANSSAQQKEPDQDVRECSLKPSQCWRVRCHVPNKCCEEKPAINGETSDGYHTFNELYEHRHALFINLINHTLHGWKSRKNSDGSSWDGWFVAGGDFGNGGFTYHLPERLWNIVHVREIDQGIWDGHKSQDVIDRLYAFAALQQNRANQAGDV